MKNKIYIWITLLGVLSVTMFSCESEEDTFKEFVSDGERVAVGAVQDVMVSLGVGKIKMEVAINADPKIKKFILKDGETVVDTLDLVRNKNGADTISYIVNLDEKLYNFSITAIDDEGNASLPYEFVSTVYADTYIKSLISRKVTSITFDPVGQLATVWLSDVPDRMKETNLTYTDRNDAEKMITVANDVSSVGISDYKLGSTPRIQSTYLPPLQEEETYFEDFVSSQINVNNDAPFPICAGEAKVTVSATAFDFGQVNNGASAVVQSFTLESADCLTDKVTVNISDAFGMSLNMTGPFEAIPIEFDDISTSKTIYVQFTANTGKNQAFNGEIRIKGGNITTIPTIALSAEEIGNAKTGLHILGPDEWPFATVDLPGDSPPRLDWGGLYHEAFFDGDPFTIGHSQVAAIPATFTIDLAKDYEIVRAGWFIRADKCCGGKRALKRYQIWGLPDGMDVNAAVPVTALTPATEKEWAQEMLDKGWTNMVVAALTENPNDSDGRVTHEVLPVKIRYVRMAVLEVFDSDTFDFGELELTADFGE